MFANGSRVCVGRFINEKINIMKTPYLDDAIRRHEKALSINMLSHGGKEALNEFKAIKQALRIHDVSGQLPNNLILYRQAKKLDYAEFCKWLNAKLGNLR